MRNPFIRRGVITPDRLEFMAATRGGSAWLWAGGAVIARAQGVSVPRGSAMVPLVAIASTITPFCFPLLLIIARHDPLLLPVAMTVIDGAHLLVLMWVQLDYAYFLAAVAKGAIGYVFAFAAMSAAPWAVGLLSAVVSFAAAWSVGRDARNAVRLYAEAESA